MGYKGCKDAAMDALAAEKAVTDGRIADLERRLAELKQILKDAVGFTDASTLAALERIGIKCISGRKHWHAKQSLARLAA